MAITNHERVGKALGLLREGLAPFVERELKVRFGEDWPQEVRHAGRMPLLSVEVLAPISHASLLQAQG
jgi:hypothetical protein